MVLPDKIISFEQVDLGQLEAGEEAQKEDQMPKPKFVNAQAM